MKRTFYQNIVCTMMVLLMALCVQAGTYTYYYWYYAELTATVASDSYSGSNPMGNVLVSTVPLAGPVVNLASSVATRQDTVFNGRADAGGNLVTFYLYAKPNAGYKFNGWNTTDIRPALFADTQSNGYECHRTTATSGTYSQSATTQPSDPYNAMVTGASVFSSTKYFVYTKCYNDVFAFFSPVQTGFDIVCQPNRSGKGNYTVNGTTITKSTTFTEGIGTDVPDGELTLTFEARPTNGNYKFFGWYTQDADGNKVYLSFDDQWTTTFTSATTIYAEFLNQNVPVYMNNRTGKYYQTLQSALTAARDQDMFVLVESGVYNENCTLTGGQVLLVPKDNRYGRMNSEPQIATAYEQPSSFVRLTFAPTATLTAEQGCAVMVGGTQLAAQGTYMAGGGPGRTTGSCGMIDMSMGGKITLNGANLYCWGFILGQDNSQGNNTAAGQIEALAGSNIYEPFVIGDWKGGSVTISMVKDNRYKVFPFNQYFIQNIEVPVTFHYGATDNCVTSIAINGEMVTQAVSLVNTTSAFFTMTTGSSMKRWYDATTDYVNYQVNGDCAIHKVTLDVQMTDVSATLNSADFVLPITNNMYVDIVSGQTQIAYDAMLLPGAKIVVERGAKMLVDKALYVTDAADWGLFACHSQYACYSFSDSPTAHIQRPTILSQLQSQQVRANLHIAGSLHLSDQAGELFTTTTGAAVTGEEGGAIHFGKSSPTAGNLFQLIGVGDEVTNYKEQYSMVVDFSAVYCTPVPVQAAALRHVDGTCLTSDGISSGTVVRNYDGYWGERRSGLYDETISASWHAAVAGNMLTLAVDFPQQLAIFTIDGQLLTQVMVQEQFICSLPAGIYLIKGSDNVSKVMIP